MTCVLRVFEDFVGYGLVCVFCVHSEEERREVKVASCCGDATQVNRNSMRLVYAWRAREKRALSDVKVRPDVCCAVQTSGDAAKKG